MKKLSLVTGFFLTVFSLTSLYSQYPGGGGGGYAREGGPSDGKITGKVTDATGGQPIEYAVIAIHKSKDSSLVTGATCDASGLFSVENLPYGRFYVEVSFVGYKKLAIPNIMITKTQTVNNIGTLKLFSSVTEIGEVVVEGNHPTIEYKIDKKVVDVSKNITAAGGTLVDALQNVPSVQVDVEGNVTLRGNANFTVLIDGKPSPLSGSEALQQIPANLVDNVEIITNPSAKYDAEGTAGIMNIIMKKQKIKGINGVVNVTAGTNEKYSANVNINYKVSKFNFLLGADYTDMKYLMKTYSQLVSDSLKRTQNGNGDFHRMGQGLKFGIDYDITKNSSISFLGNIGSRNMTRQMDNSTIDKYNYPPDSSYYISDATTQAIRSYYNLSLDYQLKLNDKGHQLSATAYFNAGPDNSPSFTVMDTTGPGGIQHKIPTGPWLNVAQNNYEKEFRGKVDYALPVGEKGKLEAGYQGRYYQNTGSDSISGSTFYVPNEHIQAQDQIQAAYVSFSNSSFIDYQLGLRAEYEIRDIKYDTLAVHTLNSVNVPLNNLFLSPAIHLSKQLPWDLQVLASYTRRINRPRDWNLNPVPRYQSLTSIMIGNPNLKPEIANTAELSLLKKLNEASFISLEGFFKETQDLMYMRPSLNHFISVATFENLGFDQSIGAELMINLALAKWFNLNMSSSDYNYHIFGQPSSNPDYHSQTFTWNVKVNPSVRLPWGMGIQINYTYNGPTINATGGKQYGYYYSTLGIRQDLFKHKGSLTLQAQNPIGYTRVQSITIGGNNVTTTGWMQRESPVFMLTFSYRMNNYKVQQNKKPTDDSNDKDQDMNGF